MNIANKITVARIFLIPIFIIFMLGPQFGESLQVADSTLPFTHILGAVIFVVAAMTDWLDGFYARKYGLVSNFGKFLDPLADKLLVTAALLSLIELQLLPAWMAIVILSREFAVTGIRLVAASDGKVIAASKLGKWKTVFQMTAITALLLHNIPFAMIGFPFAMLLMWVAVILTVWSGWDYLLKNKHIFLSSM